MLETAAGILLIAIALIDLFVTALLVRGRFSLLSPFVTRAIWWLFRRLDAGLGLGGRLMVLAGPILLVLIVLLWALLLMTGFALIYLPMLGHGIGAAAGRVDPSFWTALYFSGYDFATLGLGDVVPLSDTARMLTIVEACTGFGAVTLAISYTLNIYSAVNQHDSFALQLHGASDATGCAAVSLAGLCRQGKPDAGAGGALDGIAERTYGLLQAHHSYPLARYYRRRRPELSTARIVFHLLDLVTHIDALFAGGADDHLLRTRGYVSLRNAALAFAAIGGDGHSDGVPEAWKAHFDRSVAWLTAQGIATPPAQAAWPRYVAMRRRWDERARLMAEQMGYSYERIANPPMPDSESRWSST